MAAEPCLSRRVAALPATVDSDSADATAIPTAAPASAEPFAEEPAEGIQGFQLARQEITETAAIPATSQQRSLPGSQEDRPRSAKRADASRARGVRARDEAE